MIRDHSEMRPPSRGLRFRLILILVVLAVPVLPFLFFGEELAVSVDRWLAQPLPPLTVATLTVALLGTDIFLPIPSSLVSTFAGSACGFWLGMAATWAGMSVGGVLGFGVARRLGRRVALRFSSSTEQERIHRLSSRYGAYLIALTRPVPVLAEATVLMLGTTDLPWRAFLPALLLSNLAVAAVYAAVGHLASLPIALLAAMAIPAGLMALARRCRPPAPDSAS